MNIKEKTINALLWNLSERYGIQIFTIIIGIILARILHPEDFGLVGLMGVFFTIANVFVNSGFGSAYIQKENVNQVDASSIFYFNLVFSIFIYLIFWNIAPFIGRFYNSDVLINLFRVGSFVIIINAFSMMQISILTRDVNFKKKTLISIVASILSGSLGITMALYGYGVWSLVGQSLFRSFLSCLGLWMFYDWRPSLEFRFTSLKSMFGFSLWVLISNLFTTFFNNFYTLFIGKLFPMAELGYYSKAKGYQKMVTQQPAMAVQNVSFPVFSKFQKNPVELKRKMRKFLQSTMFFLSPVVVTLMLVAKPLFLMLLTEKWESMIVYFQFLLITGFFYPLHSLNVQVLNAQGKSKLNFNLVLIKNSFRIISLFLLFDYGILYIIYGEVVCSLIGLLINSYYTGRLIEYGFINQFKDIMRIIIISAIVLFVSFWVAGYIQSNLLNFISISILSFSIYFGLSKFFNATLFDENILIIRMKLNMNE